MGNAAVAASPQLLPTASSSKHRATNHFGRWCAGFYGPHHPGVAHAITAGRRPFARSPRVAWKCRRSSHRRDSNAGGNVRRLEGCISHTVATGGSPRDEAFDEGEGGACDVAPAVINRQGVAAAGEGNCPTSVGRVAKDRRSCAQCGDRQREHTAEGCRVVQAESWPGRPRSGHRGYRSPALCVRWASPCRPVDWATARTRS